MGKGIRIIIGSKYKKQFYFYMHISLNVANLVEPENVIQTLCEKAAVYAPEFDEKKIREDWRNGNLL